MGARSSPQRRLQEHEVTALAGDTPMTPQQGPGSLAPPSTEPTFVTLLTSGTLSQEPSLILKQLWSP